MDKCKLASQEIIFLVHLFTAKGACGSDNTCSGHPGFLSSIGEESVAESPGTGDLLWEVHPTGSKDPVAPRQVLDLGTNDEATVFSSSRSL
jgi:hypothetical protein